MFNYEINGSTAIITNDKGEAVGIAPVFDKVTYKLIKVSNCIGIVNKKWVRVDNPTQTMGEFEDVNGAQPKLDASIFLQDLIQHLGDERAIGIAKKRFEVLMKEKVAQQETDKTAKELDKLLGKVDKEKLLAMLQGK